MRFDSINNKYLSVYASKCEFKLLARSCNQQRKLLKVVRVASRYDDFNRAGSNMNLFLYCRHFHSENKFQLLWQTAWRNLYFFLGKFVKMIHLEKFLESMLQNILCIRVNFPSCLFFRETGQVIRKCIIDGVKYAMFAILDRYVID